MSAAWWSRAIEAVSHLKRGGRGQEYGEYDYDDEGSKKEMRLPVLVRGGELELIKVKRGMTVQEMLQSMTNKFNYGLVHAKRDVFNRTIGRVILDGSDRIEDIKGINWSAKDADTCNVWFVDLSQEVTVFFNTYFRMATGTPVHLQRLYIAPSMTVYEFEAAVKKSLGMDVDDRRVGLYGYMRNEVIRLDCDLLMSEVRERELEPASPSFFQFQFHVEAERAEDLGVSRASNLYMRANRGTRKIKKCWFSLQGTTLFYRPSQKDHSWVKTVENVDQCKIIYRGSNKARDSWRFDLVPPAGHGPIRVFTSPLKRRVVRWVREMRGAHASLEVNEPVSMADLLRRFPHAEIEPASHLSNARAATEKLTDIASFQRRMIELAEAQLHKVELNGGVLVLNGLDRVDEQLGRRWVESVRELLHHCLKMQATATAWKVVGVVKEILRKLKDWVQFFEDLVEHAAADRGLSPLPAPGVESLKEIIEDAAHLVNTFRFYAINLNNEHDLLENRREKSNLEEMLETMQDALAHSIFDGKARKRAVLRSNFRSVEEMSETKRREKARVKADKEAGKQREMRRKLREKDGMSTVWSLVSHGSPREDMRLGSSRLAASMDNLAIFDHVDAEEQRLRSKHHPWAEDEEDLPAEKPIKEPSWLRTKLTKFFTRKQMRRNPYEIEYDDGNMPDDASFNMSLQNGDRLSETHWSEVGDLFKQYSKNKKSMAARTLDTQAAHEPARVSEPSVPRTPIRQSFVQQGGLEDSPIIKSNFNFKNHDQPSKHSVWRVPEIHAQPSSSSPASTHTLTYDYAAELSSSQVAAGPVRTTPEDEALLLRMLKDPRVKGLLNELKEKEGPVDVRVPPVQEEAVAGWGRRR